MRPVRLTRAEQQALTRERLLAAAERVLASHGYGGASIDLVTAEAGCSKGAIYSNFESKEAVFLELLRVYMERDMAELGRIVSLDPHQLSAALSAWLETMHCDSDCPLLVTELQLHARRNPAFAKRYYALQDQQTGALARILERFFEAQSVPLEVRRGVEWQYGVPNFRLGTTSPLLVGRNEPCPCGSRRKFKVCHGRQG